MARDRDWIDYANLASNIAQNVQLRDMQQKLGMVASAIQQEQDTAECENKLREAVFQSEGMLQTLQAEADDNPRATLAWARHNLLQFQLNEVSSASFRVYEDKERLQSVVKGYEQLVRECEAVLSAQQKEKAERCAKYLVERGKLAMVIDLKERQDQLEKARLELASHPMPNPFAVWQMISVGLLLLFLWWCCFLSNEDEMMGISRTFFLWLGGGLAALGIVLVLIRENAGSKQRSHHTDVDVVARRREWAADSVKALEASTQPDLMAMLEQSFDIHSLAGLRALRNDREALIAEVIDKKCKSVVVT